MGRIWSCLEQATRPIAVSMCSYVLMFLISFLEVGCSVSSLPVFLPCTVAIHIKVHPRMGYASHMWGGSMHISLLDRVESEALRLIGSPTLMDSLLPLKFHPYVAHLSIFYRYFHSDCSSEFVNCMPHPPSVTSMHSTFHSCSSLHCPNPLCTS